ncbi:hypothetical protein ACFE04_001683 [Oxalis oulophora]
MNPGHIEKIVLLENGGKNQVKTQVRAAEMNQIKAKTQEKKEVELKKLRRRLNFKASPMPSFYSSPLPSSSEGNKKHRASVSPKVTTKEQKAEGKLKMGMRRTGNEMAAHVHIFLQLQELGTTPCEGTVLGVLDRPSVHNFFAGSGRASPAIIFQKDSVLRLMKCGES